MAKVRTRKRGKTYSYIFEIGKVDGKRKVIEKGGYPTKDTAYSAGIEAYTDWKHGGIGILSEKVLIKDFLMHWLENVAKDNIVINSYDAYKSKILLHIIPALGDIKITELTPMQVDAWLRSLSGKGLSHSTLTSCKTILNNALNYAVNPSQLIKSNPVIYAKIPKNAPKNIRERTIIDLNVFQELLTTYPLGSPYHIPIQLMYRTGMRLGEVLGLCWEQIDFKTPSIIVIQQLRRIASLHGLYFTPPKTSTSTRTIIIDKDLATILQSWKDLQERAQQEGHFLSTYKDESGRLIQQSPSLPAPLNVTQVYPICTSIKGNIVLFNAILDKLRRHGLNAHSFRHTHATMLIEAGATPKGVAGRLGHSNTNITQNLYTHETKKMQEDTANIFTALLHP